MMCSTVPLVLVALSAALAAPASLADFSPPEDYEVQSPQKRAALVLDRLLIALQKALHDNPSRPERSSNEPLIAAYSYRGDPILEAEGRRSDWLGDILRVAPLGAPQPEYTDRTSLQRRGQGSVRPKILPCYFNAITCF